MAGGKEPTFKEAVEELERITDSLESGELELEESLTLFERGVELIKLCQDKLDSAQAKVELLVDSMDGRVQSVPLDETGEEPPEG